MGSSDITNVYAALDRTHTVVALERSRRGDEGFRTFYDEFADYAANKGYIPYLLLLNFHIGDGSRLAPPGAPLARFDAAPADRSQRTRLPAGASGTAGSEGHSSSSDVVRPALLPQAWPRSAGCAEHRPEPLLQGRLRGLPQRIYSRAVAARSTLQSRGNGGRRSSFPPWRTWRRGGPQLLRLPHRTSRQQRTHLRGRNFAHIRCGTLRGAILLGGVPAVFRPRADALRAAPQRTVRQRAA